MSLQIHKLSVSFTAELLYCKVMSQYMGVETVAL